MATAVCIVCRAQEVHGTNWCPSCAFAEEQGLCRVCDRVVYGPWLADQGLCRGCRFGERTTFDGEVYYVLPSGEIHLGIDNADVRLPQVLVGDEPEPEPEPSCSLASSSWSFPPPVGKTPDGFDLFLL